VRRLSGLLALSAALWIGLTCAQASAQRSQEIDALFGDEGEGRELARETDRARVVPHPGASVSEPDAAAPEKPRSKARRRGDRRAARSSIKRRNKRDEQRQNAWHVEPTAEDFALVASHSPPPLVLRTVGDGPPVVLIPASDDGGFDAAARAEAGGALGGYEGGPEVHPRLLELIYKAVRHFDAPYARVISGIRRDRAASRHSHGMAADIVLPSVTDEALAAFFRQQGFVGVGIYPRSGFVHIDVRDQSYFWVDRSPPGRRWKVRQVRAAEAKSSDEDARLRGAEPVTSPPDLERALTKRTLRKRHRRQRATASR
jgi:hypothetical protein